MTDLTFLSAAIPLTKAIAYNGKEQRFNMTPYPMVQRVTTAFEQVSDLSGMHAALVAHGSKGDALLKGGTTRPLTDESRAGTAIDAPTDWLLLDFDKVKYAPTQAGALQALGHYVPQLNGVDCLVQLSASCFVPGAQHLSMHVFVLLSEPTDPQRIKDWLTWMNFQPQLIGELRLSHSLHSLSFPLDRTVAAPSRIIYIAPPRCVGFTPALTREQAFFIVRGTRRSFSIPPFTPIDTSVMTAKLNELRTAQHLPLRTFSTRLHNGVDVLLECDEQTIHDMRPSGEGYVQFNMNGGDSRAYWINLRQPAIIGNFKGEPYMLTEQAAPELYKALVKQAKSLPMVMPPASLELLAFFATNRQSTIYIGSYDREHDKLRLDPSTSEAAAAWKLRFGMVGGALPHYDLVFDVKSPVRFEEGYPVINLFERTQLLKKYADQEVRNQIEFATFGRAAPVISKTIWSMVGSNQLAAEYFINWIAAMFQRCEPLKTAWVFHGVPGTGKGMFIHHVLKPMFGDPAVTQQLYSILNTPFNGYLEGRLVVVYDEADLSRSHDWSEMMSKLKDWITEPSISIVDKHKSARDVTNASNFIFCSNGPRPVIVEEGDRRFNVGEYQAQRLLYTPNEYAALADGRELEPFAELLGRYAVNEEWLLHPYSGKSKTSMYESTHSLLDQIARAIHEGNLEFFVDNRPSDVVMRADYATKMPPRGEYDALLVAAVKGELSVLTPDDLYALFRIVAIGDKTFPDTPAQQRRIYQRYNLIGERNDVRVDRRTGRKVRGVKAPTWAVDDVVREKIKPLEARLQMKVVG